MPENNAADLLAQFGEDDGAATAAEVVAEKPNLVATTESTIDPASVREETVGLVTIVMDNTVSAVPLQAMMAAGHDRFIRGLYPAVKEGVAILVMAVTMDGRVIYPFTPVQDVPLLGRKPEPGDRMVVDGLGYAHMSDHLAPFLDHTPLFDRVREVSAAALVEAGKYRDPKLNRQVNVTVMTMSDGVNIRSQHTLDDVSRFMEELGDTGLFTRIDMYLGETPDPDHRNYETVRAELLDYLMRKYKQLLLNDFTAERLEGGPANKNRLSLMDLLYWYYGCMGTPRENVLLPGDNPKKFRDAVGQASDMALQASGIAVVERDEPKSE